MSYGGTCMNCGNPNSGWREYCPPCLLIEVQEKLLEQQQRDYNSHVHNSGPPETWDERLGIITGFILSISLLNYWITNMGFWESVGTVLWIPVAVIGWFLSVFGII